MEFENIPLTEEIIKEAPKSYLTTKELADRWGFSPNAVSTWRKRGQGPVFHKKGYRSVIYFMDDVELFEKENPGFAL